MIELLNLQPPEKYTSDPTGSLDVHSVWYTIQGEGPLAGCPAVFVRLAGCNLQCPGCDTDYTSTRFDFTVQQLLAKVEIVHRGDSVFTEHINPFKKLIVITGGEPFRQNIVPFIMAAHKEGWQVQIETNGLMWQEGFDHIHDPKPIVVCSPKAGTIHEKLKPHITALKYVVTAGQIDNDGLPLHVLGLPGNIAKPWPGFKGDVYLQPCDEDPEWNYQNIDAAVRSCMTHGYRMCLQTHKILGLD